MMATTYVGDGIHSDTKDVTKHIINKNDEGILTCKSDDYLNLRMPNKQKLNEQMLNKQNKNSSNFVHEDMYEQVPNQQKKNSPCLVKRRGHV